MNNSQFLKKTQSFSTRLLQGDSTNQHPFRPHTLAWHSGDYEELFIFITPCKFGAAYVIKEQGKVKHRDVILSNTGTQAAFDLAVKAARGWVKVNAPDAKLRFRSTLERAAIFGTNSIQPHIHRRAA
jgi:hypothetical protein